MICGLKSKAKLKDNREEELIKSLYEQIGQLTVERDWLKKNLSCLALERRKELIEAEHANLSVAMQCELLALNRSTYYYKKQGLKEEDYKIMKRIDEIFTEYPYYGARRMAKVLKAEGYEVGRKKISR